MKDLVNNLRRYMKLYLHLVGYNFQSALAYRGEFLLSVVSVVTELSVRLIFIAVIYKYVPTLAGWTYPQMLFLLATGFITEAIAWFTWRGSILKLHTVIQDGSYDFLMTKPVSLLFITTFRRADLEDAARVLIGIGMIIHAIQLQESIPSVQQWVLWVLSLVFAQLVYFSFGLLLKTTSFLTTQTSEINYIFYSLDRLNQYPTHIYTGLVRFLFTFIIPVTFISTMPAQFLTGTLAWVGLGGLAMFSLVTFLFSRFVFYRAIRQYSSASS